MPRPKLTAEPARPRPARSPARPPAGDARMLEVLGQFRVIVRAIKTHYQAVASTSGVGGAQLWALALVGETPGIQVTELARRMAIHQSTASNLVERLVQLRLLLRRADAADHRLVRLRLTAAGRRLVDAAPAPVHGTLQAALEAVPAERLAALAGLLDEVLAALPAAARQAKRQPLSEILGSDSPARARAGSTAAATRPSASVRTGARKSAAARSKAAAKPAPLR